MVQVLWEDSMQAAIPLRRSCVQAVGESDNAGFGQQERTAAELWALSLYAAASSTDQHPGQVSAAELRYWLQTSAQQYSAWLFEQLQRMGHRMAPATPPSEPASEGVAAADERAAQTLAKVTEEALSPRATTRWPRCGYG